MKPFFPIALLLFSSLASASLNDVYVAQGAAGANTGIDCANAHAVAFFNTPGNWGAAATQIGQDTTVHLCGTVTTALTFSGSGTSGHPITLLWETGAGVSPPTCGFSCVNTEGYDYLVLDGGTNGIIENTANGSLLPNQAVSYGIVAPSCNGCEIKNLTIRNLYVHTPPNTLVSIIGNGSTATGTCTASCSFVTGVTAYIIGNSVAGFNNVSFPVLTASGRTFTFSSATTGTGTGGIVGDISGDDTGTRGIDIGGNNWTVHNNVLHDIAWALWNSYGAGADVGGRIYNNEIYNIDHGIIVRGWGPNDVGPFYIYNNHIHDFQNWDNPGGHWHHDGIHVFSSNAGGGCPNVTELWIYNNLFDGDAGDNMTGHIFLEGGACSGGTPWTRPVADGGTGRAIVFNNVFIGTPDRVVNGYVQVGSSRGSEVYNNTLLCSNTNICFVANNALSYRFKNNFVSGSSNVLVVFGGTTSFASPNDLNNNVYANCISSGHNCFSWHGITYTDDFAAWKTVTSGDGNSVAALGDTAAVNPVGVPLAGSPLIGAGVNLASVGIAALNLDRIGAPRPPSTAWTVGAYTFTGSKLPEPPTGVTAVGK